MKKYESETLQASALWKFYERMQESVCVVDMDSYELVYANRYARKIYEIEPLEKSKGKKCYELLKGSSAPCTACNQKKLSPGFFLEEVRYNPVIKKKLALKETVIEEGGKRYRFELGVDLSAWEQQNKGYEDNEEMINEGLRIAMMESVPEDSIAALLEYLGQSLHSDRVYIFEETEDGTFQNTYEWCAGGVTPQKENLQNVSFQVVSLWYQKFMKDENVIIKSLESVREKDKPVYDYLVPQNIHSLVVSPLVREGKIIGFYGVDNPPEQFLEHITTLLRILGHFIVTILHRRNHVRRLEELCFQDQLTGIGNRHAMNEYVGAMRPGVNIGVLYCDVMGVTRVNDRKGHREGDKLLIRVGECLKKVFEGHALFRIGGDEFLVLCEGIEERELEELAALLDKEMHRKNSLMAVGRVWRARNNGDIDRLLKEADERMYEDKRIRYAQISCKEAEEKQNECLYGK